VAASGTENSLWRAPSGGGTEIQVLASVLDNNFALASKGIYFVPTFQPYSLQFHSSSVVRRRLSQSFQRNRPGACPSPPDGQSLLLFTEFDGVRADLVLMENFR